MHPEDNPLDTAQRVKGLLLGIGVGILATLIAYVGYIFFGMLTGVIAMCASAPEWWIKTYFVLALCIPIIGFLCGRKAWKWYLKTQKEKMHNQSLERTG